MSRGRTKSRQLAAAGGLLLGGFWLAAPASGASAGARPNLLLIVAEDLSPRLGAYDDPIAHTPNLDQLAEEGMRFERAFATAGFCAPSRAALILGVHQNRFGAGRTTLSACAIAITAATPLALSLAPLKMRSAPVLRIPTWS